MLGDSIHYRFTQVSRENHGSRTPSKLTAGTGLSQLEFVPLYYKPEHEASDELRLVAFHDVRHRREMVRSAALRVIDLNLDLELEIDGLRNYVHYYKLGHKDRLIFRQAWRSVRKIVRGWSHVTNDDKAAFRAGAITPFRLTSRINAAREGAVAQ